MHARFRLALTAAASVLTLAAAGQACAQGRGFTAKDMVMLDRMSDLNVSPDGRWAVYDLRTTDYDNNKAAHAAWILDTETKGAAPRRLALSDGGASNVRWSGDGHWLYFISARSGSDQVWRAGADGTGATQVTSLASDVQTFRLSKDGRKIVVAMAVADPGAVPAAGKGGPTGQTFDQLMVRHWDQWDDHTQNHLFALDLAPTGLATGPAIDLTKAYNGDIPRRPFGDEHDFDISPDGRAVAFSAKPKDRNAAWSTNFDIWTVPIDGSGAPANLSAGNPAEDDGPVWSPDGGRIAWRAMKRPGFEADRYGVMVMDLKSGQAREIDPQWDRSPDQLQWSADGKILYATAEDVGQQRVFAIDAKTGAVKALTDNGRVTEFAMAKKGLLYLHDDLSHPSNLFLAGAKGAPAQLSHVDEDKLAGIAMGQAEQFAFPGWNGETVHGYVVKPANFDPSKKYPVAFLIHGGPQGTFGNLFHYRWNAQTYAGAGYAVVMVDFHGSTGYGQGFTDAISKHWGDRPLEDLQKGWAYAQAKYSFLDGSRACALGGSYGGYMVNWIAGNWSQPWKCLVSHDGVFDNRMMGYATEELWFSEWENGGTVAANPAGYEQFNPIDHAGDWNKPELVIQGGRDYRIPLDQGLGIFSALQRKGVESKFLYFPDENHWVLKPKNSVQWHETVMDWLNRHTG